MDLRDDYLGEKWSHATVMRRISDEIGISHLIEVGTRAPSREEYAFAKKAGLNFFTSETIKKNQKETIGKIKKLLVDASKIFLTIDVDCLDPSVAPGVGNPESEGIDLTMLIDVIQGIIDQRTIGFDVVEVSPPNDPSGITAVAAAKLTFELISLYAKTMTTEEKARFC
jgi:agmatinase